MACQSLDENPEVLGITVIALIYATEADTLFSIRVHWSKYIANIIISLKSRGIEPLICSRKSAVPEVVLSVVGRAHSEG